MNSLADSGQCWPPSTLDRHLGNPLVDQAGAAAVLEVIIGTGALTEYEKMIDSNVAKALGALAAAPLYRGGEKRPR